MLLQLRGGNRWEYRVVEPPNIRRLNVEPHVLLTDDLETLNFDALAVNSPTPAVSSPVGPITLFTAANYEYHPPLNDAQPLISWFRSTGIEEARCVAYGTSLMETLAKLSLGQSIGIDIAGERRLKPMAALLDLELFQPQGDGRLYLNWTPNRLELIKWSVAACGVALAGCAIIIWRMRRTRQRSQTT